MFSSLRTASNYVVVFLLLGFSVYVADLLMVWVDAEPFFGCRVIPVWEKVAVPLATLVTLFGLAVCLMSGMRNSFGVPLVLLGVFFGILPSFVAYILDPLC